MSSLGEALTAHFYRWESRGRGYYHFDAKIALEPPFVPFFHQLPTKKKVVDDGRFSVVDSVLKLFDSSQEHNNTVEEEPLLPMLLEGFSKQTAFSISFPQGTEISRVVFQAFLNALSFSYETLSFEILANTEQITVQFVCSDLDSTRVQSHLKAYFPSVIIHECEGNDFGFEMENPIALCDFAYAEEFMRPIYSPDSFAIDPLTSCIAHLESLQENDTAVVQILFKGCLAPWKESILCSVSDGTGGSFFADDFQMLQCGKEKVAHPLMSVVIRLAVQGQNEQRTTQLAEQCVQSIVAISRSEYNYLIPLSNEGYEYESHLQNLYHRTSNRLGMLMNTHELVNFVHYPNRSITSKKLGLGQAKTKVLPKETVGQDCVLGLNLHQGSKKEVSLGKEARLRHTYIIGATGVGKSTLIASMMLEDIKQGRGCVLFDPHGDIAEDILMRIPESRKEDVIVVDPSDTDFPIGFNLFDAHSEAEKIVLSSDLVSAFKRHATAWGDNMTAVLSNTINAFLESTKGGTLIELKRFLLEEKFREAFLETVEDPSIHYYWEHEYPMVRKGIAPLLTRIDTFLRPKVVRYMLAQQGGLDFRACIEEKKVVLLKLSQGLIGKDNSYLLGSLFLSKFNQVAQGRQMLSKDKRHPYYVYLDEFQNFITPSISQILSGARKYGLGLVLAHQELAQIEESKILNSVISNPYIRICFRLGDNDAKRLSDGFSYFEADDLQNLGIGEAIIRIGSKKNDCNMKTFPMPELTVDSEPIKNYIVQRSRENYATPREEIEKILEQMLPQRKKRSEEEVKSNVAPEVKTEKLEIPSPPIPKNKKQTSFVESSSDFEVQKQTFIKQAKEKEVLRKHRSLQNYVKTLATARGFKATLEAETKSGGRVDVALLQDDIKIAIEISVTNTPDYEVKNLEKCLSENYDVVYLLSEDKAHLEAIEHLALETIHKKDHAKLHFLSPEKLSEHLDAFVPKVKVPEKRIRGYRVKLNYTPDSKTEKKKQSLTDLLMQSLRKKK